MKLQIELNPSMKQAAEARAVAMGYASLAALLKVLAANLAQQHQEAQPAPTPLPPAPTLKPTVVQPPVIPPAEQFSVWPKYISRNIVHSDPAYYLFLIKVGQIR